MRRYVLRHFFRIFTFTFLSFSYSLIAQEPDYTRSIVKIITTANGYNYKTPWQAPSQYEKFGTGFIISNQRIMTNAHLVADNAFIEVRRTDDITPYKAKVAWVDHDCDLAILAVDESSFFEKALPLEFGAHPKVTDKIYVLGFPMGGDEMSVTEGIISRIEVQEYTHSKQYLLLAQIDAAINPGNSGAPVLRQGKVIGVVSQGIPYAQNIGYMIPMQIVKHFIFETEQNIYNGFPSIGISIQYLENKSLRESYGMKPEQTGILITELSPEFIGDEFDLNINDIILAINDVPVANNGTVLIDSRTRVRADHLIHQQYIGDSTSFKILRKGKEIKVQIPLKYKVSQFQLVPERQYDRKPTYYIFAGFIFQPLTANYLSTFSSEVDSYGESWTAQAPLALTYLYRHGRKSTSTSQIVLLNRVLPDSVNIGYQYLRDIIVEKVNNQTVNSFVDLFNAIKNNKSKYHKFVTNMNEQIIIDKSTSEARHSAILKKYNIPSDKSDDLL